ncbi:MAG: helix-turn-helix domain-containing protein [Chloroflexota bacterium]|nr:helix-turn-helix domain-containing protein [Chloroflexota bacterium]
MPGHHPFSELRAKIDADPVRAARLAEAERQLAAEQVAYDRALAEVRRARTYTQVQLGRALGVSQAQVSRTEYQTDLYLSTLQSYLDALGGELELSIRFGDTLIPLTLTDLFSSGDTVSDVELEREVS